MNSLGSRTPGGEDQNTRIAEAAKVITNTPSIRIRLADDSPATQGILQTLAQVIVWRFLSNDDPYLRINTYELLGHE